MPDQLTTYMDAHGDNLLANGFHPIPIIPNMKLPGRYQRDKWFPLENWQQFCLRQPKQIEVDFWKRWPGCAVGLACGKVIGIDIDIVSDPKLALELENLARSMLGDTPALRIGQAPKRALFYRTDVPFGGRKMHPLEIYGTGSQMVVYATHEKTGKPYQWPNESLVEIDYDQLPAITEAMAIDWLRAAYARVPDELRPKKLNESVERSVWSGPSDPKGTYEAVKSALSFIPNDDLDGTSWVAMLNAIKAALGEAGLDLWLDWSKSSSKSGASGKSDTAEKRWKTAKPREIGAGTIYYQAEQRGWIPETDLILNGSVAADPDAPHPAAAFLARYGGGDDGGVPAEPLPAVPVPKELWDIGGILGMLIRLATDSARSPQPFLALGAALCLVGTVAGQKYKTATNLRSNFYGIGIADSGGGKDNARVVMEEALFAADLPLYLGGEEIASGSALYASLKRHPCRLFQIDEMGKFMAKSTGKKAAGYKAEVWENLTKLFTSANRTMIGTEYANQEERPRIDIVQPCCSFWGVTVPGRFWSSLESEALSDGSMARFLIFLTDNDYPERNKRPAPMKFSDDLITGLQAIHYGMDEAPTGNLAGVLKPKVPNPYPVPETEEAKRIFDELDDHQTDWLRQSKGTPNTSIIARYWENIAKISLIRAISDNPQNPRITEEIVRWAEALVEHCTRTLMREADRFVAVNEQEAAVKRILHFISKSGSITRNVLTRNTQYLTEKQRNDILASLIQSGQVKMEQIKGDGAGRSATRYSIVRDRD